MKGNFSIPQGVTVIAEEPASFVGYDKKAHTTDRIVQLLLSSGDTVYGCTLCEYKALKFGAVRGHLNAHSDKRAQQSGDELLDLANELRNRLRKIAPESDVESWKKRALKAERALRDIKRSLGIDAA